MFEDMIDEERHESGIIAMNVMADVTSSHEQSCR